MLTTQQLNALQRLTRDEHQYREMVGILQEAQVVVPGAAATISPAAQTAQTRQTSQPDSVLYQELLEEATDLVQSMAPDGRLLYANRAWRERLGYTEMEIPFLRMTDIVHPSCVDDCNHILENLLTSPGPQVVEITFITSAGQPFQVSGRVDCRFEDGKPCFTRGIFRDISGEARTKEQLRLHAQILDQIHDSVVSTDLEGRITSWNRAAEHLFGYKEDELLGQPITVLYPENQHYSLTTQIIAPLTREGHLEIEVQMCRKSGQRFHAHLAMSMMFDADGQPNGMISYVVDKTAEKRAQSEFHRYHQLLECISRAQATYISGAGPQQLFEALLRDVLQLTESEYGFISEVVLEGDTPVLNNPFAASVSPSIQSRPLYHESIIAGKASENLATLAAPVLRSRAPLICNLQKLGDLKERIPHSHPPLKAFLAMPVLSGSRFVGMLTIANRPGGYDDSVVQHLRSLVATVANLIEAIRQRSERERADQALLESERRLTQFLDALPAGILVIDSGGQSQYANQAAVKLFGSSVDHSKSLLELIQALQLRTSDGGMYPKASLPLVRALNGEQCWADDLEIQGEDKAIPLEVTASPIYASEGEVVYAIAAFSDISERKRVDRMKREFISTVSHELRTPLTSIRGSLGLLVGGAAGVLPTSAQTMLDIAYRNSERLVRLINDILDVEKIESGKLPFNLQEVCLRPLLQQALESNAAYAREFGVEYELDHGGADVQVLVDPDRLLQVLTNLLGNAAKFSPPGAVVKLVTLCSKTSVRVEIRDRGPGIPLSFREKIFQKFSQADASDARQKGGSGLGLSIAKAIVERLGGQVDYVSEVGKGSTFFFELPINGPFPVLPREGGPGTRAHILICEDDPDVASLLRLYLTRAGFGTDVAPNLTLARQLLGEKEYSAMTLDLRLPGESGLNFLRSISRDERLSRLPVIVVSAISEQGRDELNGDAVSFVQWLGKPIEELRLLAAVESATRGNESLPHILHIEDDQGLRQIVAQILKGRAEVTTVATLEEARHQIHQTRFDLIMLDLHLDDGHGSELVPILNHSPNQGVPVVVFSAFEPTQQLLDQVSAALVKTRTTNEELARTIFRLIRYAGVSDEEGAG